MSLPPASTGLGMETILSCCSFAQLKRGVPRPRVPSRRCTTTTLPPRSTAHTNRLPPLFFYPWLLLAFGPGLAHCLCHRSSSSSPSSSSSSALSACHTQAASAYRLPLSLSHYFFLSLPPPPPWSFLLPAGLACSLVRGSPFGRPTPYSAGGFAASNQHLLSSAHGLQQRRRRPHRGRSPPPAAFLLQLQYISGGGEEEEREKKTALE